MKRVIVFLCVFWAASAYGATLTASDAALIAARGIPVWDKADFVFGNKDVGFRFASKQSPEAARSWYREQLSGWSLFDSYGAWILYDGKPGLGMAEMMEKNQVAIQANAQLPQWHSLDKSMTTEIVIMVSGSVP